MSLIIKDILNFIEDNKWKFIGAICGLFIAIIFLRFGFWKGLFLLLCILIGIWMGNFRDNKESFLNILAKIFHVDN